MLQENELQEIRTLLENSTNPIYLFDDDGDGLCSFLLLKKFYKKGIGIPIKTPGPLNTFYIEKIENEKADLVVILDKALVTQEFIDSCSCNVLYIDHHPIQNLKRVHYFNPLKHNKNTYTPTSEIVYNITRSHLWIAVVGCLFDYKIPNFMKQFKKEYPKLVPKTTKDAGYYKYETELGKLINIFNFSIKGKSEDVKKLIMAQEKVESPYEILEQTTEQGKLLYERYEKLNKEFEKIFQEAEKEVTKDKIILFIYQPSRVSFITDIATRLSYYHQDKTIIIAREKDNEIKMSIRNQKKNIRKALEKSLKGIEGYGGGHIHAVGATIKRKDFDTFIERMKKFAK